MSAEAGSMTWESAVVWLRNQPDRRQLVLDAYFDDPLATAARRYHASDEWREITLLLRGRTGKALDVGAGRGIASYALARDGFAVTALEPDPSGIVGSAAIRALAAETVLPIEVVEEFSERLPFADGAFDVVFARAVLHHTGDLDGACAEMFRVLRHGGIFIAVREHVISSERDLKAFLDDHPLHRLYGGEHAFLLDRYLCALKHAGFGSIKVLSPLASPINFSPYTLDTLRDAIVDLASQKLSGRWFWRRLLDSNRLFGLLLSVASRFDNRPGRLYSFVAYKNP